MANVAMSIVTVAKKAGVSVATVSRVLNDSPNVRAETAQQVRDAIQQIGYKPPRVKRGPKTGMARAGANHLLKRRIRPGQIAVLVLGSGRTWLEMPVMAAVLGGIGVAAKDLDLGVLLEAMPDPQVVSPLIRRRQAAGAIVFVQSGVPAESILQVKRHAPVVWVMGGESAVADVDHISADNIGVGNVAFGYLNERRCQHLAFIASEPSWHIMRLRGQSFANAARDAGRSITSYIVGADPLVGSAYGRELVTADSIDKLCDKLAAVKQRPIGLFSPTDLLTTRLYPLLIERGVRPESDVITISCDNEEARLSALNPRPASIDIRPEDIGRCAVARLIERLNHPDEPAARIQIAPRLVGAT